MRKTSAALCFAALAWLLADGASFACPAQGTIFQDSFTDKTGGWDQDPAMSFGAAGLTTVMGPTQTVFRELDKAFLATDGDYCADMIVPAKIANVAYVGVLFWAIDYNNYYLFQVSTAGHAQIYRYANSQWISLFDAPSPAVKSAGGSSNEVRVVAKGNLMTAYVNGQKVTTLRGQPPAANVNSEFGYYLQLDTASPDADARTFVIKDYTVNAPS